MVLSAVADARSRSEWSCQNNNTNLNRIVKRVVAVAIVAFVIFALAYLPTAAGCQHNGKPSTPGDFVVHTLNGALGDVAEDLGVINAINKVFDAVGNEALRYGD